MDAPTSFKLDELAKAAAVSPRTVRYYVQRGLLSPPVFRGKDTAYGPEHLRRLRAIRRLQDLYWPLDGIQAELARRTEDEIDALADGRDSPVPAAASPAPPSAPAAAAPSAVPASAERWTRLVLQPGLELHLAEHADESTRALAERLLREAQTFPDDGEKKR